MNEPKPRLCLIYCGGTIGMVRDAHGVARPPENPEDFLCVAPELGERYDLDFILLLNKDSSDITPADWATLAVAINERRGGAVGDSGGYDGIVVVHGTDTMAYTAAAVAMALGPPPLDVPVLFTGAMRPADADDPDGPRNLADACAAAADDFGEVLIVFGGQILRGCRAHKQHADRLDAFTSPSFPALGRIEAGVIVTEDRELKRAAAPNPGDVRIGFAEGVLPITLCPGLKPKLFSPALETGDVSGVVLQGFGNANVPTEQANGWLDFIRMAEGRDVPVLLVSLLSGGSEGRTRYAGAQAALDAGAIDGGNLTFECAVAKLSWAVAQARGPGGGGAVLPAVRSVMQRVVAGEMDG